MALRIPKSNIKEGKYTSGGEFIVESTNAIYKGYYYEFNNILYAGKSYEPKALKIVPIKDSNTLLNKGRSTALFSLISGITSQALQSPKITSIPNGPVSKGNELTSDTLKFYCRNTTQKDIIIKEIDENTYKSIQQTPSYQTTTIKFVPSPGFPSGVPQNLDQAEKELPGIKAFLLG